MSNSFIDEIQKEYNKLYEKYGKDYFLISDCQDIIDTIGAISIIFQDERPHTSYLHNFFKLKLMTLGWIPSTVYDPAKRLHSLMRDFNELDEVDRLFFNTIIRDLNK